MLAVGALGVFFIFAGVRRWSADQAPKHVIAALAEAIRDGNPEAARQLLAPRTAGSRRMLNVVDWTPSPGLEYRIHKLEVFGDIARAELWLADVGYVIKPEITLEQLTDGDWKITDISKMEVDPRWLEAERQQQAVADERLAQELNTALRERPGVIVERETDVRRR